ncbi:MAG: RDD family protein [Armatimonadetes bacterium]|nr:RDD family protein [Armatimonadota bacterium]
MARTIEVLTPENITLSLEPAGIGTRFGAVLLDMLIQFGIAIGGSILLGMGTGLLGWNVGGTVFEVSLIIGGFLLLFGYFILFETIWNGQTPGKKAFGLRVVKDGGRPVDFLAVAIRNLVRLADFLPGVYAFGAGAIFFNRQYKRFGDMAAGTIVIREREARTLGFAWKPEPKKNPKQDANVSKSVAAAQLAAAAQFKNARLPETATNPDVVLTHGEQALMRRFALRRWEMTPDDAERMGYRIIVPLVSRLNLQFVAGAPPHYADLVSTVVAELDRTQEERDAGRTL